jgi:hypothetical protein
MTPVPTQIKAMAPSRNALVPVAGRELESSAAAAGVELEVAGLVVPDGVTAEAPCCGVVVDEAAVGAVTPSYQAMSAAATGSPIGSACKAGPAGWLMSSPLAVAVFS